MKVFWSHVDLAEVEGGVTPRLDGKPVRTPAKAPLVLPTRALGEACAEEWRAQTGQVAPSSMPVTRAANSAIDRVCLAHDAVAGELAAYAQTDLLCYRVPHPAELAARQAAAWDPLLHWAAAALGAWLEPTDAILPHPQPAEAEAALNRIVSAYSSWELTGLYDLVTLSGSLVIGLAVAHRRLEADTAWAASRIEEAWNIEQWGEDAEAAEHAARKARAFTDAARWLELLRRA